MIPIALILAATAIFFVAERVLPGRELPEAPGWYARAAFLNLSQVGIVLLAGVAWNQWLQHWSIFHISRSTPALLQGLFGWFIGTFVFYWWHRVRHDSNFLWRVCHQIHHSPARIELLTAFYKHPLEIACDSMIASALMYSFLGASSRQALGSTSLLSSASTSTTAICALRVGWDTSCSDRSITPSTISWMCTSSTTETSRGGIASSERFERLTISLHNAASPTGMRRTWAEC